MLTQSSNSTALCIEDLYQKWRSGLVSFDQVRNEYQALLRLESVSFIFSVVNGQVAMFERHPQTLVKPARKSTGSRPFTGDLTPNFPGAET